MLCKTEESGCGTYAFYVGNSKIKWSGVSCKHLLRNNFIGIELIRCCL